MGYTHYYYVPKEFNSELFAKVVTDFKKVLPEILKVKFDEDHEVSLVHSGKEIKLVNGHAEKDTKPEITNEAICFNGEGGLGHETFCLEQKREPSKFDQEDNGKFFEFTKTARKPYDLAVCAVLIIAKQHLNDHILVRSDGDLDNEWVFPKEFVQKHLGYGKEFVLDTEDSS